MNYSPSNYALRMSGATVGTNYGTGWGNGTNLGLSNRRANSFPATGAGFSTGSSYFGGANLYNPYSAYSTPHFHSYPSYGHGHHHHGHGIPSAFGTAAIISSVLNPLTHTVDSIGRNALGWRYLFTGDVPGEKNKSPFAEVAEYNAQMAGVLGMIQTTQNMNKVMDAQMKQFDGHSHGGLDSHENSFLADDISDRLKETSQLRKDIRGNEDLSAKDKRTVQRDLSKIRSKLGSYLDHIDHGGTLTRRQQSDLEDLMFELDSMHEDYGVIEESPPNTAGEPEEGTKVEPQVETGATDAAAATAETPEAPKPTTLAARLDELQKNEKIKPFI